MIDDASTSSHEDRFTRAMNERRGLEAQRLEIENEKMRRSLALKDRPLRRFYHDHAMFVWLMAGSVVAGVALGLAL